MANGTVTQQLVKTSPEFNVFSRSADGKTLNLDGWMRKATSAKGNEYLHITLKAEANGEAGKQYFIFPNAKAGQEIPAAAPAAPAKTVRKNQKLQL